MIRFGTAIAEENSGEASTEAAAEAARSQLKGAKPALAITFASVTYEDLSRVPRAVSRVLGGAPVVGGTAGGCLIGPGGVSSRAVTVVALGGDEVEAKVVTAKLRSPDLLEVVPAAQSLARAADEAATRGLTEFTCLVFSPGFGADGESLVAAVRKGVGPRVQLAGGLTGDDLTLDRARVFAEGESTADMAVLTGIFTTKPLGLAARHGYRPQGGTHKVTRSDGPWLLELDGRGAFEVWLEEAAAAGLDVPDGRGSDVAVYLANHFSLGLLDSKRPEPILRSPVDLRRGGGVKLSGSVGEGKRTRFMLPLRSGMLEASEAAATAAQEAAGARDIQGALVLACTGRMITLGSDFPRETSGIAKNVGAPIGGVCVYGEIARARRDTEAFHNATTVVLAVPGSS
jgi:hypothetical protein